MIRVLFLCALAVVLAAAPSGAQTDNYFQQFIHYKMQVRLDPEQHMLTGSETIEYTNNSPDTLREFYLHLYPNAYRSKDTPFMRDFRRRYNFNWFDLPEEHRGWLDLKNVKIFGTEVTPKVGVTIARMDLPKPLLPGARMTVTLDFESKIRKHLGRAGYSGNHYDFAQWYPKVVVYDEKGFHPDAFMTGEFYGEFGTFDVEVEVPENYVIAATGVVKSGDPGWDLNEPGQKKLAKKTDTYKKVHFHAENVHDFAWNVDPAFAVQDTIWNNIEIRSFFNRNNTAWKDTTLVHAVRAIQWLSEKVGPYPYPQVSVVQGLLGGGMEYPMLVMDGRASETLVVHEIGHIYFYGIFGNDERAEAWLDEGFTTFQTDWYAINRYGPWGDRKTLGWYDRLTPRPTRVQSTRNNLFPIVALGYGERVSQRAETYENSYRAMVYWKASLMFHALRYVVGDDTFDEILKEYFRRYKFKHVNEARFVQVCEEVSGRDLDWFFGEWLHSRKVCDYAITGVRTEPSPAGDAYRTKVRIERKGEITIPLSLQFTFQDGTTQKAPIEYADARLRTAIKEFDFPEKPKAVALNPDNEIMDIDLADNFSPRRRALDIDWPNNNYYPEDAMQYRVRPEGWYNDADGAKLGLHVKRRNDPWSRNILAAAYYGIESHRFDFKLGLYQPLNIFWNRSMLEVSGYKLEGRNDITVDLTTYKRPTLIRPPTHRLYAGVNHHTLSNFDYRVNPETYQGGNDFSWYVRYSVDPQADIAFSRFTAEFRNGRRWFGGDYDYTSFWFEWWMRTREDLLWLDGGLRIFAGFVSGDLPYQRKFSMAGGGVLAEEQHFWLRSPGAIWDDARYHQAGQGNLRGYFEGSFNVNRLTGLNLELGRKVPFISASPTRWWGTIRAMVFADAGNILDRENPIGSSARVEALVDDGILRKGLVDAGVGVNLHRSFPFYDLRLRFDIPFWLNRPEVNGESKETQFRHVWSLEASF